MNRCKYKNKSTDKKVAVPHEKQYIDSLRKNFSFKRKSERTYEYENANEKQKRGWRLFENYVDGYNKNTPGLKLLILGR